MLTYPTSYYLRSSTSTPSTPRESTSNKRNSNQALAKMSPTIFFSVVATFIALTTGTSAQNQHDTRIRPDSQSQRGFYNPNETGFFTIRTTSRKDKYPPPITQRAAAEATWIALDPPSSSTTASNNRPWAWRKPKITPAGPTNPATFTAPLWNETPPPQRTPVVDPLLPETLTSVTKTLVTRASGENAFVDVKSVDMPESHRPGEDGTEMMTEVFETVTTVPEEE